MRACPRAAVGFFVESKKALQPTLRLCLVPAHLPEAPGRFRELEGELRVSVSRQAVERNADVVMLSLERVEPLPRDGGMRLDLPGEREVVLRVPPMQVMRFAHGVEPLGRVLADRLEHPVARPSLRLALPQQALVEQRLERVWVGAGDLLRGLVRAAAGEDGEASEEALLLFCEQVIRPLDRRPQGLLARIGVAPALEQIETLREALE